MACSRLGFVSAFCNIQSFVLLSIHDKHRNYLNAFIDFHQNFSRSNFRNHRIPLGGLRTSRVVLLSVLQYYDSAIKFSILSLRLLLFLTFAFISMVDSPSLQLQ